MEKKEFTVDELRSHLEQMSVTYDLARVVDPIECRIIELHDDGSISMNHKCYGIWNADQKCVNCSSSLACRTGCRQEKTEQFDSRIFDIQSDPVTLLMPDGEAYPAVMELVNIRKEGSIDASANDREAENRDHSASEFMALHDHLTKVLSAGPFYEKARALLDDKPELTWVMISADIMNFRLVNTIFGVMKGNEALVTTAAMLDSIAERSGGICGRLGGDQFALLIPEAGFSEAVLQDTENELSGYFSSGIFTFRVHFGIYLIEDTSVPVSVMYGRANSALRTIREDISRVTARYDDEMLRKTLIEQKIISGFEDALGSGRFLMYLQPLVDEDGRIIGAEALARWRRTDGSIVMPGDFIGILENAGLIHHLDRHIWELAVRQLREWQGSSLGNIPISVNLSAKDFYSIDVYDVLTDLVERYEVDSSRLRLEITETALLEEPEKSDMIISELRGRGFIVEIDDFGKGYSSLSMLKDIRADVLKIDMSLLNEIESNPRSRIILGSVINMADLLGMDVITEGIETVQQHETLISLGCRHFQGFYFSPPVPVAEFEKQCRKAV